ncbi:receptor-type tyrosine-protein phosphatase H-like isoform X5 [Plectropomus leopardus]|uniref:receptor-type tyrosine-protein phosphatase H-like isoform X5 n=1 Tax=Plectropomus leopardus TaxID=160734 RepID=UPI001C4C50F8|nr:receptor-type tyrosine-protein phosphatase H-like isoform X5 [Plectropomus leopardus]
MKPLSFKVISDHFLLCVFLSLLWGVTDITTTRTPSTTLTTVTSTTQAVTTETTTAASTTPAIKSPPGNVENVTVSSQNETSITLVWNKVDNLLTYFLQYNNSGSLKVDTVVAQEEGLSVIHVVDSLTPGTKYDFRLITESDGGNSTGYSFEAVTAPLNAMGFKSVGESETSITLQWEKVNNFLNYRLVFNGQEINVTASAGHQVTHTVPGLTSMTRYVFTLFTLFGNVKSHGVTTPAFTAPPNAEDFKSVGENETSITLQWKQVDGIINYTLVYNEKETDVPASAGQDLITYTIPGLTNGTKYVFTLFTVFHGIRSSGENTTALTIPLDAMGFKSVGESETSITLQWEKVNDFLNYRLVFDGEEINVTASAGHQVTHTVPGLTSMTRYVFTLFTLFGNVKSRGVTTPAFTAPRNTEKFDTVEQNETSITLQWQKVDGLLNYTLVFNEKEISVTASVGNEVTHTVSGLTSMTRYVFTLFTLFENVRSSGVNTTAFTAPRNTEAIESAGQNETSITLQWKEVNGVTNYILVLDKREIDVSALMGQEKVIHTISGLTSGTKYNFTLYSLFGNVRSSGLNYSAATVPSMVALVEVTERSATTITLTWQRVKTDWDYFLLIKGGNTQRLPDRAPDVVSRSVTSLKPGTKYFFSVITTFSGHNSTAYSNYTVTMIDCATVNWHVTNSSIQGTVKGLFSKATATYQSQIHTSHGGSNVTFTGLYPGATYEVSLEYENDSRRYPQCNHNLTIIPPLLSGHCEYWAAGYSLYIVWDNPKGVWTSVEVNVMGQSHTQLANGEQYLILSGFQPARKYEVSITSISGTVRSYKPYVFQCLTDPRGVIAGSVFAVLLFVILVCVAVFIFLKRPDIISRKKSFIGGSKQTNKKSKAISVAKFPDHFTQLSADENRGFTQEYESLSPVGTEQTRKVASLLENKTRNRFNNVQPYDWCRVKLTTSSSIGASDYINASYMPGYNNSREYIASQGPLPTTVNDFWRMVWEQRVNCIVMVTNCTEGGKIKCERYWPADTQPCSYGELEVTLTSEQQEINWTLREFSVKHSNNSEERIVKHFHFTAWPDHGVPQGTEDLIQFRGLVRLHIEREGTRAPTVVHCSAGVGRTGTIIALDVLLQQLEKERAVGINGFVHKMRLNRPYMVQTESQYVFLHQCIMDSLQPHETADENIYENADMIYANATALRDLR